MLTVNIKSLLNLLALTTYTLMIDSSQEMGHIKVIDFGTCKVLASVLTHNLFCHTMCVCVRVLINPKFFWLLTLLVSLLYSEKDLQYTEFNGPEFVGTPQYMSPQVASGVILGYFGLFCLTLELIGHL